MKSFRTGELKVDGGATIFIEKSANLNLYAVLEGAGFRCKMLEDRLRQTLNYLLSGDLASLQEVWPM